MHIDHLYTTNIPLVKRKAVEGDAQFQLILGMMYYRGESVFHDKEKAKCWIRKSAENGNEVASKLADVLTMRGLSIKFCWTIYPNCHS